MSTDEGIKGLEKTAGEETEILKINREIRPQLVREDACASKVPAFSYEYPPFY